jgi:hypothetical protein
MRKSVVIAIAATLLVGCDKPSIQQVFVTGQEDQPKVITADIVPTGNIEPGAAVELVQLAPTQGATGRVTMTQTGTVGAHARYQTTVPVGSAPAMPYGTQWSATVSVPYNVLWQRNTVTASTVFIVGAAEGCASFDGELEHEGWTRSTRVLSTEAGRPEINAVVAHLPDENARPSVVTGALSITIPDLPTRVGNEVWSTRFGASSLLGSWADATGIRVAVNSSDNLFVRAALLMNRGVVEGNPAAPVLEWVYTQNKPVEGGGWQIIELPFPTFPAPLPGNERTFLSSLTINLDTVRPEMQIMIDDVCPMHQ